MDFRVGQKVMLINNGNMAAPVGTTAVVIAVDDWLRGHIKVVWEENVSGQIDGHYRSSCFKSLPAKNQQLLFSFME